MCAVRAAHMEPSSLSGGGSIAATTSSQPTDVGRPHNVLFVQNLPEGTTEAMLAVLFKQFPGQTWCCVCSEQVMPRRSARGLLFTQLQGFKHAVWSQGSLASLLWTSEATCRCGPLLFACLGVSSVMRHIIVEFSSNSLCVSHIGQPDNYRLCPTLHQLQSAFGHQYSLAWQHPHAVSSFVATRNLHRIY